MKITMARIIVKAWDAKRKAMVLKDVAHLIDLNNKASTMETVKISAHTSFILEKCFRKGVDINPEQIAELVA